MYSIEFKSPDGLQTFFSFSSDPDYGKAVEASKRRLSKMGVDVSKLKLVKAKANA